MYLLDEVAHLVREVHHRVESADGARVEIAAGLERDAIGHDPPLTDIVMTTGAELIGIDRNHRRIIGKLIRYLV